MPVLLHLVGFLQPRITMHRTTNIKFNVWFMRYVQLKLVNTCGWALSCNRLMPAVSLPWYLFLMLVRVLKVLDSNVWHQLCHCVFHSPEAGLCQCPSGPVYGFTTWYAIFTLCCTFIGCSYSTSQLHTVIQVSAGVFTESNTKLCSLYCHSSATGRLHLYIPYISPSSQVI